MTRYALSTLITGPALVVLGAVALVARLAPEVPVVDAEAVRARAAYAGSARCKACHAAHYASWHATYHRRMTAPADSDNVLGAFDGRTLEYGGVRAVLDRDPTGAPRLRVLRPGEPERSTRIVRTVGSHRFQQYLGEQDGAFERLPVAWDVSEQRFVHMNTAFLTPDPEPAASGTAIALSDYDRHVTRWNDNCIYCHNTAPVPGLDPQSGAFDTHVAELGVACEACHGPGSEHVRRNKNPVHRYLLHLGLRAERSVANAARMDAERASQVCGRCHGQRLSADIARVHAEGDRYVPGEDLRRYSRPLQHDTTLNGDAGVFAERFWSDGTPRLTAYEYQGLLQSPCHMRGPLECESCHDMHGAEPDLQPRAGREGDRACTHCHREYESAEARARHSGHTPDSAVARCVACHMPRVVYGLGGMRISHRIEVPDPARHAAAGRPDACTLCHLEQSQAWAATQTARLWPSSSAATGEAPTATAAPAGGQPVEGWAATRLFGGDPIERATAAAALGAETLAPGMPIPLRAALLLETMRSDRYPALRKIAWHSLQALARREPSLPSIARDAYDPALNAAQRQVQVAALRLALNVAGALLDPARVAALRATAPARDIFIGE